MDFKNKLTIDDIDIRGKHVFVRVDYNVPLDENGIIQDDRRIRATLPTLRKIINDGGLPIIASHLGRPKGKYVSGLSMEPVARRLEQLLGRPVTFLPDSSGEIVLRARKEAQTGDVILLENLRFHKEEERNDPDFAKQLAGYADLYINDAFGACHRAHASISAIQDYVEVAAAGYLLKKEMEMLGKLLVDPEKPFVAIIGGAKISSKIGIIEHLMDKTDKILIGGAMSYTFFKSLGIDVGDSLVEDDKLDVARHILEKAEAHKGIGGRIFLPIDAVVTDDISDKGVRKVVNYEEIPHNMGGVDIGPNTIERYKKEIKGCETIVINGPLGVFEIDQFSRGTREILTAIANHVENGGIGIIGGGDSAAAARKFGLADKMTHVSTGGGASLKLMEGKPLPGIEALTDK